MLTSKLKVEAVKGRPRRVGQGRTTDGPLNGRQGRIYTLTERVCLTPRRAGGVDHGARRGVLETVSFEHLQRDEENGGDENRRDNRAVRG